MKKILTTLLYAMEKGQDCILVTIVGQAGSVPRGIGSQMLVGAAGRLSGTIGGGAVEHHAIEMSKELIARKCCLLHTFYLHRNKQEDIGMVCGGDVTVWFQYISCADALWKNAASAALEQMEKHRAGLFALQLETGKPFLLGEHEELLAGEDGRNGKYFSMPLPIGERAIIFGAGHIARALVPILDSVGFRPVIYDNRPEYVEPSEFSQAEQIICGAYERFAEHVHVEPEDYFVVMTSGHEYDYVLQRQLLQMDFAYIGVVGSRRKKAAVNAKLLADGIPEEAINRVHTPIGTMIKAVTPAEIAISIAGEMIYERAIRREQKAEQTDKLAQESTALSENHAAQEGKVVR